MKQTNMFALIMSWLERQGVRDRGHGVTQTVNQADFVRNVLDDPLGELQNRLKSLKDTATTDDNQQRN